jgi:SAM-dependent methyltransferase
VLRWLDDGRRAALQPFLDQYRRVRESDGYRVASPEYYRRLPTVDPDDPEGTVWRVRRESYVRLRQLLLGRFRRTPIRVLDLGAGCGWLSARLADSGASPVAVDLLDDDLDGLGACRHYGKPFPRVVADFDDLPFDKAQFEAVIFNGSLHYAPDTSATLAYAATLLAPGGMLVVADSPMFETAASGQAMCARRVAAFRQQYGISSPIQPGEGFVTFAGLSAVAARLSRDCHFFESHGPAWWPARRMLARLVRRHQPARFGVWVAT